MLNPEILPLKKWGDAGFDESKVRRDDDGKFAPKGSGQKQRSKTHDQVAQVAGAGAGLAASAATIGAGRAIGHAVGARRGERDQLRRDRDRIKQAYRAGGGPRPTHQRAEELASAARRKIQEEAAARGESGPEVDRRAEQMYRKVKQSRSKENPGKRDARIKGSVNMARQMADTSRVIGRVRGGAMGAARGGLAALGPAVLAGSAAYGAVHGSSIFDKASAFDDFGVKALRKWGDAGFDESKVRRDDDGKFAPKGGGGAPVSGAPRKHYGVVRDSKGNLFSIHDESAIGEGITIDKDGYIRSGDRTYVLDARTGSPVEIKAPAAPTVQTRSNGDREKRSRLAGAGRYGLRGAAAGAAIGAAGGAAYGSRYGRVGILAGALGGAMSGAKTGAIGGGIYGAVAPGYKRAAKKASAFDDFGVRALRKWGASGFDESKVRRDDDGKFTSKGGDGGGKRRATLGDRFGGSIRGDAVGLFSGMGAGAAAGFAAERLKRAGSGRRGAKLGAVVGGSLGSTAGLVYGAMNPSRRTGRERDVSKAAAFGDFGGRAPAQVGRRRRANLSQN